MKFDNVPGSGSSTGTARCRSTISRALVSRNCVAAGSDRRPGVRVTTQLAVGLLCGLLIALVMRSALGVRIRESAVRSSRWGPALTGAVVLSAACLASINLLLARFWLTPLTIGCAAAVVVLGNPSGFVRLVRRAADSGAAPCGARRRVDGGAAGGHRRRCCPLCRRRGHREGTADTG